ncbi:MAG TPA: hypothetical protein IAB45_00915 [Candidatus Onthousia faecavium]|nr:hypothetical protein [Candidatus Onthousia faecavium]
MLASRMDRLSTDLKNCLHLDNIEEIISKMERFYSSFVLENKLKEIDIVTDKIILNINNKTKIYKSSEVFTFLGVNYKVKNNKISRRIVSKTRGRVLKKNIKCYLKYEK